MTPETVEEEDLSAAKLKKKILRDLQKTLAETKSKMTRAQERYKQDFDKRVYKTLRVKPGDYVFIDRPKRQLKAASSDKDETYNPSLKLLPRTTGPFLVKKANEDTIVVEEDGLLNTVSIDRVSLAPATTVRTREIEVTAEPEGPFVDEPVDDDEEMEPTYFAIERIVKHDETKEG